VPVPQVEASKFTSRYVGRDVDSIVRDLVEVAVKLVRDEEAAKVRPRAKDAAEERLLDLLLRARVAARSPIARTSRPHPVATRRARSCARCCRDGRLDDREVEIELTDDSNR